MREIHGVQGRRAAREADWAEGLVRDLPEAVRLTLTDDMGGTAMHMAPNTARKLAEMLKESADRVEAGMARER